MTSFVTAESGMKWIMGDKTPIYVRLFNMLSAIRDLSPFNVLTADEELLLGDLVVRWHEAPSITISDLMQDGRYSSQSTAYRRLIALRDKGLITLRVDDQDKRVKFVEPTSFAQDYMERIGQSLTMLMRADKPA